MLCAAEPMHTAMRVPETTIDTVNDVESSRNFATCSVADEVKLFSRNAHNPMPMAPPPAPANAAVTRWSTAASLRLFFG